MADVTLKYKGATIGELSESGSKTIKTAGKYCEADILLEYVKSGGSAAIEVNPATTISNNNMLNSVGSLKTAVFDAIGGVPFVAMYKSGPQPNNYLTWLYFIPAGSAGNANDVFVLCRAGNISNFIIGTNTSNYVNISADATYLVMDLSGIYGG